ncbi:hypothetical protein T265_15708, partial [Opisthorchis viverrini]
YIISRPSCPKAAIQENFFQRISGYCEDSVGSGVTNLLYLLIRQSVISGQSVVSAADPLQCLVSERKDSQKGTQQMYSERASACVWNMTSHTCLAFCDSPTKLFQK